MPYLLRSAQLIREFIESIDERIAARRA